MTAEEQNALCWLVGEEAAKKCEGWRDAWDPAVTADAARLARSCYAEGFIKAAVMAYRRIHANEI